MPKRTITLLSFFVLGIVGLVGAGLWLTAAPKSGAVFDPTTSEFLFAPNNPEVVALGSQVYADNCASCHGDNLQGAVNWQTPDENGQLPAPPHDETGHTWHHSEELLFRITKYGSAAALLSDDPVLSMPAFEDILHDGEILAVLSFIKAQWPKDVQEMHDRMSR